MQPIPPARLKAIGTASLGRAVPAFVAVSISFKTGPAFRPEPPPERAEAQTLIPARAPI